MPFILFIFFFVFLGPMVYVIVSEIWPQAPRPAAMSISYIVNWSTNFSIGMFFPFLSVSWN